MVKFTKKLIIILLIVILFDFFSPSDVLNKGISVDQESVENPIEKKIDNTESNSVLNKKIVWFVAGMVLTALIISWFYFNSGDNSSTNNIDSTSLEIVNQVAKNFAELETRDKIQNLLYQLNEVSDDQFCKSVNHIVTNAFTDPNNKEEAVKALQAYLNKLLVNSDLNCLNDPEQVKQIVNKIITLINKKK